MEQLNLSDAINLHPEITVNTSCQRMETVDQEKGTAEPYKKNCAGAAKSSSFERQETARYSPEYFDVRKIE